MNERNKPIRAYMYVRKQQFRYAIYKGKNVGIFYLFTLVLLFFLSALTYMMIQIVVIAIDATKHSANVHLTNVYIYLSMRKITIIRMIYKCTSKKHINLGLDVGISCSYSLIVICDRKNKDSSMIITTTELAITLRYYIYLYLILFYQYLYFLFLRYLLVCYVILYSYYLYLCNIVTAIFKLLLFKIVLSYLLFCVLFCELCLQIDINKIECQRTSKDIDLF